MAKTSDTFVISGISGAFPSSENVEELKRNLYNKVNLTERIATEWHEALPEVPVMMGRLRDKTRFDAGFFGVSANASNSMDPMGRMLLEKTYEAILDSGTNPTELQGSRTAVIVCLMHSDTEQHWSNELKNYDSGLKHSMKTALAKRIAYHFKFIGPAFTVDSACSSSMYAIEQAVKLMRNGVIDNAIIGGCNFILNPLVTLQFTGLGALSMDAMCRPFDEEGTGYVRGETLVSIFLQRSQNARRIYAEIVNVKSNCDGFKDQSITFPSQEGQSELLRNFYSGCGVDPREIAYVEAHGTGTPAGDPVELNAIESVFCKDRTTPLLIGSMKANTGHAEPASGLNSVIKVILTMERGAIVPTINHRRARKNISGLVDGRLRVVTDEVPLPIDRPMVGVNSFGFGGANGHLLLKANTKSNVRTRDLDMPLLIGASSRTRNGIASFLERTVESAKNLEYVSLLHSIFRCPTPGNHYRGYVILKEDKLYRKSINCTERRKSLSLVFGRPNRNWSNSHNDLQQLPIFRDYIKTIESQCESIDLPVKVSDLLKNTEEADRYPLMRAVLMQVGLYHVLTSLNVAVDPNKVRGHSFGQIAVAFIKNELSLEETMLTAFFSSAIVDNDYNATQKNDADANSNNNFMVLDKLPNAVKNKLNKWLLSMQTYLADVKHDEEVELHIGEEISVNLDGKVRMNLCSSGTILSLLESLGRLYEYGYDVDLLKLYPAVKFPVGRGTPMIAPQIKWKHDKEWFVMRYRAESDCEYFHRIVTVNLREKEWEHVKGHVIDGRILLPAAAYIFIAWDTLAALKGKPKFGMKYLTVKSPRFLRTVPLDEDRPTELTILLRKSTGQYTIKESGNVVGTGEIFESEHSTLLNEIPPFDEVKSGYFALNIKDVYKEFTIRNYDYHGMFKSIVSCNSEATHAMFEWRRNYFVPFLDGMFQFPLIEVDTRKLRVPVGVDRITIDVQNQLKLHDGLVPVEYHPQSGILRSKYVEFRGSQANSISKRKQMSHPVVKSYQFVPHEAELSKSFALNVLMQLIVENTSGLRLKVIEMLDERLTPLCDDIVDVLKTEPLVQADIKLLTNEFVQFDGKFHKIQTLIGENDCQLIITSNLSKSDKFLDQILSATSEQGFVLTRETANSSANFKNLITIATITTDEEKFVLLRKPQRQQKERAFVDVSNSVECYDWLAELQQNLNKDRKIVVISQGQPLCGILGLVNCMRREMGAENLQCVFVYDDDKKPESFLNEQLSHGLLFNVWKDNEWGTYRYLPIDEHQNVESECRYISVTKPGDLSSAKWLQGPEITDSDRNNIVYVNFAAINNKDVMISKGLLPTDLIEGNTEHSYNPGFEFSGTDLNNNRVMGLVKHSALANIVIANPLTLWKIPEHWSLQDAATVPLVYCTVLYSLIMVVKVKKGQTILIHSGSGGIGQAAINIALFCGLKVFTTVGSDAKRDYIKRKFPQIRDNQIGYSRDSSFEQLIMTQTRGVGVDVLLNSQNEENFHASVSCLAKRGHFVEIGRQNMDNDNKLSVEVFTKGTVFCGIDIEKCLDNERNVQIVSYLLKEAIDKGFVKPLERHTFEEHQIQDAFNLMSSGQHVGKILIKINQPSADNKMMAVRRYSCNPNGSYVLIGGLGGFGMELANWLITRGCRKIVLTSRVGVTNGYQDMRIRCWRTSGVQVEILTSDVTTNNGCRKILESANKMGPVVSIFNLAVVLRDSLVENQTVEKFKISFAPKVVASIILDSLSRTLCPQLKDFVIFSSVVSGWGNTGQSNYGMANSVMERICEQRRKDNLPGLAIQWGAIGNVGILMEKEDAPKIVGGTALQSITSCLKVMDRVLRRDEIIFTSMLIAEKNETKDEEITMKDVVAQILGIRNVKTVGNTLTLPQLGLDSVMVVEVKEKLERMFGVYLTLQEIRKLTFDDLEKLQEPKQ